MYFIPIQIGSPGSQNITTGDPCVTIMGDSCFLCSLLSLLILFSMSMYYFVIVKTIDSLTILTFKWHVHKM